MNGEDWWGFVYFSHLYRLHRGEKQDKIVGIGGGCHGEEVDVVVLSKT